LFIFIGVEGLCEKTLSNLEHGLTTDDVALRESWFGSNHKKPPVLTPFFKLFLAALDDFMLKFLSICAIIHLGFELGFAEDDHRKTGKSHICLSNLFYPRLDKHLITSINFGKF
jgi:hypothetical protein